MKTNQTIKMGNDEFILYIRKNSNCETPTNVLGRQISSWFKTKNIAPTQRDIDCYWETIGASIDEKFLPKTAAQFEFNRSLLPELFTHLDELKNQ
jgi:hypothetical protein